MSNQSLRPQEPREIRRLSGRVLHDLRMAIPAGKIVRRLGGFATGAWEHVRVPSDDGVETYVDRPIEMNANQVRAAVALLNKVMPDLQSMQLEVSANAFEEKSTEQLRAELRAIITGSDVIDVPATIVGPRVEDLLSCNDGSDINKLLEY